MVGWLVGIGYLICVQHHRRNRGSRKRCPLYSLLLAWLCHTWTRYKECAEIHGIYVGFQGCKVCSIYHPTITSFLLFLLWQAYIVLKYSWFIVTERSSNFSVYGTAKLSVTYHNKLPKLRFEGKNKHLLLNIHIATILIYLLTNMLPSFPISPRSAPITLASRVDLMHCWWCKKKTCYLKIQISYRRGLPSNIWV